MKNFSFTPSSIKLSFNCETGLNVVSSFAAVFRHSEASRRREVAARHASPVPSGYRASRSTENRSLKLGFVGQSGWDFAVTCSGIKQLGVHGNICKNDIMKKDPITGRFYKCYDTLHLNIG